MFGMLEAVSVPHAGGIFSSYDDLMLELNNRMEKDGYKIVKSRSHRSRQGGADVPNNDIVRCDLVCDRGGRPYKCMATKHKTSTKKTDCPWKAKAVHRKTIGGWVLTISCDQHNHEPGTPEPPTPSEVSENEDNDAEEADDGGPRPDAETAAAIQVAGVSDAVLRLTGDTFHQFKSDYRKMSQPERLGLLAQLQLRIAAIYAVQNEDVQRNKRQEAQDKRHRDIEGSQVELTAQRHRARQERRQQNRQQSRQDHQQQQQLPQQHQQQQQLPQQSVQGLSIGHDQAHMMQQSPFHMQHSTELILPVPGVDMPDFEHFPGPPRRIRGQRQSQAGDQAGQGP